LRFGLQSRAAIALLGLLAIGASAPSLHGPWPLRLQAIQARLIYYDGSFSANIVDSTNVWTLWNTIIGEGDAKKPSHATMIEVPVTGSPHADPRPVIVQLFVAGGRYYPRDVPLLPFDSTGLQVARFRLDGTGCNRLALKAQLKGPGVTDSVFEDIPFACGE
jgi:hypothetical protein